MMRGPWRRPTAILCVLGALLAGCTSTRPAPTPVATPAPPPPTWRAPEHVLGGGPAKKGTRVAVGKEYLVSADLGEIYEDDPYMFVALYSQNLTTGEVRRLNFWSDWRETEIDDQGVGADVVVAARFNGSESAVDVIPLDGSIMYPRLEVWGLLSATVQGDQAVYIISGDDHPLVGAPGRQRCVRSFAGRVWGPAHCEPIS